MKKSDRIRDFVDQLQPNTADSPYDPRYSGFFTCFNAQQYYEAHDVLEDLWLKAPGANYAYFKGLIQLAGAFVHLQKQAARPDHPKDGRRLHPAARLFHLAEQNLQTYGPAHLGLDLTLVQHLIRQYTAALDASAFSRNPWHPDHAPQLALA